MDEGASFKAKTDILWSGGCDMRAWETNLRETYRYLRAICRELRWACRNLRESGHFADS